MWMCISSLEKGKTAPGVEPISIAAARELTPCCRLHKLLRPGRYNIGDRKTHIIWIPFTGEFCTQNPKHTCLLFILSNGKTGAAKLFAFGTYTGMFINTCGSEFYV